MMAVNEENYEGPIISEYDFTAPVPTNVSQSKDTPKPSSVMDIFEKRVIRRKYFLLETHLIPTHEQLKSLIQQGLLPDNFIQQFKAQPCNKSKARLLIDLLQEVTTFEKFLYFLDGLGLNWISDELKAELMWERGKLKIEEYILQEAAMIVERILGNNTAIDDTEKKDFSGALASKHQMAKQAWKLQLQRKAQEVTSEVRSIQDDILKIYSDIDALMELKKQLKPGSARTLRAAVTEKTPPANMRILSQRVRELGGLLQEVLDQHKGALADRDTCYTLLGNTPEDGTVSEILEMTLKKNAHDLGQSQDEVASRKQLSTNLDKQIAELSACYDVLDKLA